MKTLVLCVDRDNDLGEKTGLGSPVIGRENCLSAATELGIKDPEETDTNAIFMAVKLLDTLKKEGKEAEMAVVTGHKYLGDKADRTIADQMDQVLNKVDPQRAVLVSDGIIDETIIPILQSRVKIDYVHRFRFTKYKVEKWEEKFYALMRYLSHESVRIGLGVPITLLMIFYGAFAFTGYFNTPQNTAGGAVLLLVGIYFLTRSLQLQERSRSYINTLRKDIRSASLNPVIALVTMVLLIVGSYISYIRVEEGGTGWVATSDALLQFSIEITWWVILAILLRLAGAFLNQYLRFNKVRLSFLHHSMQVVAFGFIIYGALIALNFILVISRQDGERAFPVLDVAIYVIIGVILASVSALVYRLIRTRIKDGSGSKAKSA